MTYRFFSPVESSCPNKSTARKIGCANICVGFGVGCILDSDVDLRQESIPAYEESTLPQNEVVEIGAVGLIRTQPLTDKRAKAEEPTGQGEVALKARGVTYVPKHKSI